MRVDLNCDLGESFGRYTLGLDDEVIKYVSSANVACGMHASDPQVMAKTVRLAKAAGAAVGAHPGFADLQGFGRRNMDLSPMELHDLVLYQLGALDGFCRAEGIKLSHVKPHGAMYNMAVKNAAMAGAICRAARDFDPALSILAPDGSELQRAAAECGLSFICEVFADRAYQPDGTLVPRKMPGAMIDDEEEAISRVVRMVKTGLVRAISGEDIKVKAESICVHGDSSKALVFVQKIRVALQDAGIEIKRGGREDD
ncbi:MAG TPA: LamB/YcsF family protein [Candidatus Avidehalobacter gallistercoris]|uniref:5-oxoprolinase subunit A n=1 Tax=Candidatus Avidehalobacter gallistercoris TaxID=2840694 RepID=A0A9D1HJH0_9FIRM|nr:LamB/YcsF family protein [Candidatus Avidehalobacter gallistercoris]